MRKKIYFQIKNGLYSWFDLYILNLVVQKFIIIRGDFYAGNETFKRTKRRTASEKN